MHCQLLLHLFLVGLLVTQMESRDTMATKIWKSAKEYIGSTEWSFANSWNGDDDYKNKWKSNLFVYDVLQEVNAVTPTRWSWSEFRYAIAPVGTNEWANPDSGHVQDTNCYQTVDISTKQKGDIIAFQRTGNSGHMGIVSTGGDYISAQEREVKEDDVNSFLRRDVSIVGTTVWRYTC